MKYYVIHNSKKSYIEAYGAKTRHHLAAAIGARHFIINSTGEKYSIDDVRAIPDGQIPLFIQAIVGTIIALIVPGAGFICAILFVAMTVYHNEAREQEAAVFNQS